MARIPSGPEPKTRLVYILAASHSGSTLLASLFGCHAEVCTAGELKLTSLGDITRYLCSCRAPVEQCPFWLAVSEEMERRGFPFSIRDPGTDIRAGANAYVSRLLQPLHRGPFLEHLRDAALSLSSWWRAHLPKVQARNAALTASICARTGKPVLVDSSKIALRLKYLLRTDGLDVKVIRLIRDGRGVALTYTDPANLADAKDQHLRGGGTGESRDHERISLTSAAWEWRRSNEEAEAILAQLPQDRWTEVRYETLCAEQETTMGRLFSFIGVDPERGRNRLRSGEHHIIGNGMRFDTTSDVVLDERWRHMLKADQLQLFDTIAGQVSRRLGYM